MGELLWYCCCPVCGSPSINWIWDFILSWLRSSYHLVWKVKTNKQKRKLLCLWTWSIHFSGFHHPPIDVCSTASCDFLCRVHLDFPSLNSSSFLNLHVLRFLTFVTLSFLNMFSFPFSFWDTHSAYVGYFCHSLPFYIMFLFFASVKKNCFKWLVFISDCFFCLIKSLFNQIRSVAQSCPTLCNPMNHSTPGLPVHHQLPEFTETHIHRDSDAIQPSHPLSSPSPPAPNPSQHQSFFQWVNSF